MRKLSAIVVAIILLCTMSVTVFAEEKTAISFEIGSLPKAAEVSPIKTLGASPENISVEITWTEETNAITVTGADFSWDPETCSYKTTGTPSATGSVVYTLNISNNSDCDIGYAVTYSSTSTIFNTNLKSGESHSGTVAGEGQESGDVTVTVEVTGIADADGVNSAADGSMQTLGTLTCTIAHVHTYSNEWSSDDTNHWHVSTCGHEAKADEAAHDYDGNYVCKTCGYTHTHSFSEEWSSDDTNHWHACTCGAKADEAAHIYDNDSDTDCNECDYTKSCFVAGTQVSMADGTTKNIEDVKIGNVVIAYDTIKGELYETVVVNTVQGTSKSISTVTLSDGTTVKCTPSHPLYTTDGWKSVDPSYHTDGMTEYPSCTLNVGDKVYTTNGVMTVVSIGTDSVSETPVYTLTVKSNGGPENCTYIANTIVVHNTSCLAKGSKITMADGSVKVIEDITEGDVVLTFNHEKGVYEGQKVYLAWKCETPARAFTLNFTNGIQLSVIGDHCLFEKESLSYVAIFESNAEDFIGRHFYNATEGRYEELLSVTYGEEPVEYYEIYTEYNANCIAENLLNVAYDSSEMLNIYKFNEDLSIDGEQLEKDIARFGLYEYPEDANYSKELYDAFGWKYINLMVGKGFGTWDDFVARRDAFLAGRE